MSLQNTRLTEVSYVPGAVGSLYNNPAGAKTFVRGILLSNTDASDRAVIIYWVPDVSGALGTATNATKIFPQISLATNESLFIEFPFALVMLDENESVQAIADASSKVTCVLFGDIDQ